VRVVSLRGVTTSGGMAPEISLERQRPAQQFFSRHVEEALARLDERDAPKLAAGGD
jgi:hypothetical protein